MLVPSTQPHTFSNAPSGFVAFTTSSGFTIRYACSIHSFVHVSDTAVYCALYVEARPCCLLNCTIYILMSTVFRAILLREKLLLVPAICELPKILSHFPFENKKQTRPDPTGSDRIRPDPTGSDRIRPDPTGDLRWDDTIGACS